MVELVFASMHRGSDTSHNAHVCSLCCTTITRSYIGDHGKTSSQNISGNGRTKNAVGRSAMCGMICRADVVALSCLTHSGMMDIGSILRDMDISTSICISDNLNTCASCFQ